MKITLGEEVVISRAPEGVKDWGPWQFPTLYNCQGKLYVEFHAARDSARDYAVPRKRYVTSNKGESWKESDDFCGLELENGEIIRPHIKPSVPETEVSLPEEIGQVEAYGLIRKIYKMSEVNDQYTGWYLDRYSPVTDTVSTEKVKVKVPGFTVSVTEGVLPSNFFWSLQLGFKGTIWTPLYKELCFDGESLVNLTPMYLKSDDDGKSFETVGRIFYEPPYEKDPDSSRRGGFSEPSIQFLDEDNGFSILRVTDGLSIGPSYISYTKDGGVSWSRPEYFDDRGVWPQSVLLENGVVLAGYGRTGLFVRPFVEGAWFDRVAIVEPADYQTETCSYCAIKPISANTALIVYSKFQYPDEKGIPRKTILCRTVTVNI